MASKAKSSSPLLTHIKTSSPTDENSPEDAEKKDIQGFLLVVGLYFLFFTMHNYLQELISKQEGFHNNLIVGFAEVLGVTSFSFVERLSKKEPRKSPLRIYILLTICLMASSGLSNQALNYLNFPTKVIFRSCKLIPTMFMAVVINGRAFPPAEYLTGLAVCAGLILFTLADVTSLDSFDPRGIVLVSLSTIADSILPNLQEKAYSLGSSRLEITFYSNIYTLCWM
eukprot:CAMPEP_0177637432 /NCGR_PEP_ID=MMETSP0447-20121125/4968_1 /TAXON_ID=0 /ORGANISM="Stygamoeba regulata, Strain BSH-02190019" /LENGTH=225 /DNA_ID=CAMNT_0019139359 /DNA_START=107 /DNA_END=781 /DNA_ORIENTATION=-